MRRDGYEMRWPTVGKPPIGAISKVFTEPNGLVGTQPYQAERRL
jgi:hypothetical protein